MAPEVALGQPYNQSVDTYSYAMVCWELGYGHKPFMGMNVESHRQVHSRATGSTMIKC